MPQLTECLEEANYLIGLVTSLQSKIDFYYKVILEGVNVHMYIYNHVMIYNSPGACVLLWEICD